MGYKLQKIYIGQNQVRPSSGGGRQPGANTTMYFKFNGDLKEEISGTTYTASGITYSDLPNGNKYANFPGNSSGRFQISNNISDSGNEITLLAWFQVANTNNMRNEFSNSSGGYYTSIIFDGGNLGAYYYDNSLDICGGSSWSSVLYNSNERHLYGQTIKAGGKIKIFLDGQKVGEKNMEATLRGSSADGSQYIGCGRYGSGPYFNGKMSELIGEKVEWTETEVSDYYNQTKGNYGGLPSEYQEVEYIDSSYSVRQYIETGLSSNGSYFKAEYKFQLLSTSSNDYWTTPFMWGPVDGGQLYQTINADRTNFQFGAGNDDIYGSNIAINTDYTVTAEWNNGTLSTNINGTTVTYTYSGGLSTHTIPIFCRWRNNSKGYDFFSSMRLYYFKMYTASNTLARDLVPCYRIADSVIGMYDLVNNQFYTNAGSGTFTKGPDVN